MSVPIMPLADYIVAQGEEAVSKTASGLFLPGTAAEKPKVATLFVSIPYILPLLAPNELRLLNHAQPLEKGLRLRVYILVKSKYNPNLPSIELRQCADFYCPYANRRRE